MCVCVWRQFFHFTFEYVCGAVYGLCSEVFGKQIVDGGAGRGDRIEIGVSQRNRNLMVVSVMGERLAAGRFHHEPNDNQLGMKYDDGLYGL